MKGRAKMNAMRSAVVVVGALAFGYLTLQLGFKPYLEKAQLEQQALLQAQHNNFDDTPAASATTPLSDDSDHKL